MRITRLTSFTYARFVLGVGAAQPVCLLASGGGEVRTDARMMRRTKATTAIKIRLFL